MVTPPENYGLMAKAAMPKGELPEVVNNSKIL
jgi:hypothetical protein